MDKCTNVCGLTVAALKEAGTTGLEVRRPSGKVLQVALVEGEYFIGDEVNGQVEVVELHTSLGALKKALRKY